MEPGRIADRVEDRRRDASSRQVHDARTASVLGIALGVAFLTCLLTGVYSHLHQQPPSWFDPAGGPAGLYRVTQGLHVATGLATVPLLLAKLCAVSPQLLRRPVLRGPVDDLPAIARDAGFSACAVRERSGRHCATLTGPGRCRASVLR